MAASENVQLGPRLPLGAANHCMSLSSQMVKSPRAFEAALYAYQCVCCRACDPARFTLAESLPQQLTTFMQYRRSDLKKYCTNGYMVATRVEKQESPLFFK